MARIEYPECGQIINTHGCRGAVKIEPWCDSPEVLAALPAVYLPENGGYRRLRVRKSSIFRRFVLAELEGIERMEDADRLRGCVLHAHRDDLGLGEDVLLVAELIGLPAIDAESGARLGTVTDIIHPGASDIYVIKTPTGGEAMVPAVPEFVREISAERGVLLSPIEGMFDDAL